MGVPKHLALDLIHLTGYTKSSIYKPLSILIIKV